MTSNARGPVISVILAVSDAAAAAQGYAKGLGATELWNLGGVVALTVEGAPFFLGEPARNGWNTPSECGTRTVRFEVFVDDPDTFIERAVAAGADGSICMRPRLPALLADEWPGWDGNQGRAGAAGHRHDRHHLAVHRQRAERPIV